MANYAHWQNKSVAELASITDGVTNADKAYMEAYASDQLAAIFDELGTGPSGNLADLTTRLAVSVEADGTMVDAEVLAALLGVDGAGSLLDADKLDGQHGNYYSAAANISGTIGTIAKFTAIDAVGDSIITESGTVITIAGTQQITYDAAATYGLTIQNDDDGITPQAGLILFNNSASPAAADCVAAILMRGRDATPQTVAYGGIYTYIVDPSAGSVDGRIVFSTPVNNVFDARMQIDSGVTVYGDLSVEGGTTIGNAAGDALTFHPSAWTLSNAVTITGTWTNLGTVTTVNIDGGTVDGMTIATSDITVGAGKTLDVSAGTLTLAGNQISGDKVHGGTISAFASTGIDDNADTLAITINSDENVGIGTNNPLSSAGVSRFLQIYKSGASAGIELSYSTWDWEIYNDAGTLTFAFEAGTKMTIASGGLVTVAGAFTVNGVANISTATNWQLGDAAYTGTMANLNALRDDSMADALHRHSELSAGDGAPNPAWQVDADGHLLPAADSTYNIGSNAVRPANIYVDTLTATDLTISNDVDVAGGIRSTAVYSWAAGVSVAMYYTAGVGYLLAYDWDTPAYKPLAFGGSSFTFAVSNVSMADVTSGGIKVYESGDASNYGQFSAAADILYIDSFGTAANSGGITFRVDDANVTAMTILANGKIGMGTTAIPHGAKGIALLALEGTGGGSNTSAIQFTTTTDDYPLLQVLPWTHDDMWISFDAYWDGGANWDSGDAGSNFQLGKSGDKFKIRYDSGIAQNSAITWNEGIVMDTSGNIGIGTASPANLLDLTKEGAAGGNSLRLENNWTANSNMEIKFYKSRGNSKVSPTVITTGDYLSLIRIYGHDGTNYNESARIAFITEGTIALGQTPTSISFYTDNTSGAFAERMRITPDGNVGINDTTPTYKLDVNGTLRATGAVMLDSTLGVTGTSTLGVVNISGDVNVDSGVLFVDVSANRVGINDATPSYSLDVDGTLRVTGSSRLEGGLESLGNTVIGNAAGDALTFHPNGWTLTNAVTIGGTWADLGTVTTVDINGGTIDGTIIGGAAAAAASVITLIASGDVQILKNAPQLALKDTEINTESIISFSQNTNDLAAFISHDAANDLFKIGSVLSEDFVFYVGNTERVRINSGDSKSRLTETDNGAVGCYLELFHESADPAANDIPGALFFVGRDSGANETLYGAIYAEIISPTTPNEYSRLNLGTTNNGSSSYPLHIYGGKVGVGTAAAAGLPTYNLQVHVSGAAATMGIWSDNNHPDQYPVLFFINEDEGSADTEMNGNNTYIGRNDVNDAWVTYGSFGQYSTDVTKGSEDGAFIWRTVTAGVENTLIMYLFSSGTLYIDGTYETFSDIRLKRNIEPIVNALSLLSGLEGIYYHRNDMPAKHDRRLLGLSAQDVQDVLPEAVNVGQDGMLTLNYDGFVPVLVNAVNELSDGQNIIKSDIEVLQERLEKVESEKVGLEQRVAELEKAA